MSTPLPPSPEHDGVPDGPADGTRPGPAVPSPGGPVPTGPAPTSPGPQGAPAAAPGSGPWGAAPGGAPRQPGRAGGPGRPDQGESFTGTRANPYPGPQGAPHPGPQPGPAPRRSGHAMSSFFGSLRRTGLVRTEERWVGGVCGGLARRLGVDPVLVRAGLVVLSVFTGLGLVLYGLGWALLPEELDGRIHLEQAVSGDLDSGFAGAVGTFVAGWALFDRGLVPTWYVDLWGGGSLAESIWTALWIGVLVIGLVAVLRWFLGRDERRARRSPSPGAYPSPVPPGSYRTTAGQGGPVPQPAAGPAQPAAAPRPAGPGAPAGTPFTVGTAPLPVPGPALPVGAPANPATASPVYPGPGASGPAGPAQAAPSGTGAGRVPAGAAYPAGGGPAPWPGGGGVPAPVAAPLPPRPAPPVRPRVPGPGRTLSLVVLGLVLLVLAGTGLAAYQGALGFLGAPLVAFGAVVALLGAGVTASALRGRRGGWMSGLGVLALVVGVPALVVSAATPSALVSMGTERTVGAVNATYEDSQVSVGAGSVTLDLRSMPEDAAARTIEVSVGAGNVEIRSNAAQAVRIIQTRGPGSTYLRLFPGWEEQGTPVDQVTWDETYQEEPRWYAADGSDLPRTFYHDTSLTVDGQELSSSAVADGDTPQVTVVVEIGTGDLHVLEAPAEPAWSGIKDDTAWVVKQWMSPSGATSDDVPVTGVTHPAISWDDAWTCLAAAGDGSTYPDLAALDTVTGAQRAAYDTCVARVLAGEDAEQAAVPTPGPTPGTGATPTPAATDAEPTPAPTP